MAYFNGNQILTKMYLINNATPIEISTAAEMDAVLVAANVGKVYKYTGTTTSTYTNGDLYEVIEE